VSLRLRVRSGALADRGFEFNRSPVRIGRQQGLELTFDPQGDLGVSALHAELLELDGDWYVRDLGSRNGTYVNGVMAGGVEGVGTKLSDGDLLLFGNGGPEVEVRLPETTLSRIERATAERTRGLRVSLVLLAVGLGLAVVAAGVAFQGRTGAVNDARADLVTQVDSLLAELEADAPRLAGGSMIGSPAGAPDVGSAASGAGSPPAPGAAAGMAATEAAPAPAPAGNPAVEGELAALSAALQRSQAELREIREALRESPPPGTGAGASGIPAPADDATTEALRRQLQEATAALRRQQLAGSMDLEVIQARSRQAVALVFVESQAGQVSTGTAFSVRSDGTLLTVRHLVQPPSSVGPPARIAVQFTDSEQVWPARLVAVSEELDLAALRVENILGEIPVVRGFNTRPDTLGTGIPVASLGFPLGGIGEPGTAARPLVTVGVLGALSPDRIEVYGYGDVGASGSPIFDGSGEVLGILFGGRDEGSERILFAVNAVQAVRFLARIPVQTR
jgi:pSer/pThr/pTyr-binding forkhead associated (FHA) protein